MILLALTSVSVLVLRDSLAQGSSDECDDQLIFPESSPIQDARIPLNNATGKMSLIFDRCSPMFISAYSTNGERMFKISFSNDTVRIKSNNFPRDCNTDLEYWITWDATKFKFGSGLTPDDLILLRINGQLVDYSGRNLWITWNNSSYSLGRGLRPGTSVIVVDSLDGPLTQLNVNLTTSRLRGALLNDCGIIHHWFINVFGFECNLSYSGRYRSNRLLGHLLPSVADGVSELGKQTYSVLLVKRTK
ncbi:hypothetical protein CAPTEDRAFT_201717, partial [Capitella teleta]